MRVKVLLALAIASVLLFCPMGVAAADTITGVPTASDLTNMADQQIGAYGFPDLDSIGTMDEAGLVPQDNVGMMDEAGLVPQDNVDAMTLSSPLCGVCGGILPDCSCSDTMNVIPGPRVNLGCPIVTTYPVPVYLETPKICPKFEPIDIAPQYCLGLPQVNLKTYCNDIACSPVTNINSCPVIVDDC